VFQSLAPRPGPPLYNDQVQTPSPAPGPVGQEAARPAAVGYRLSGQQLLRHLLLVLVFVLSAAGGSLTGLLLAYQSDLPQVSSLEDYKPNIITELFSDEGNVFAEFAVEKRVVVAYGDLPEHLKQAIIATEDQHFFDHPGLDLKGLLRAVYVNLVHGRREGASTITQQLSRLLFLKPDVTLERKVKELILSFQIEKNYTKEEILTLYCNQVMMGPVYGVESASQYYFGKHTRELSLVEGALLAANAKHPSRFNPVVNPKRALERRNHVLDRMAAENYVTRVEADLAKNEPIRLRTRNRDVSIAPYFAEEVRKYLEERYGSRSIYEQGLRVYTTLNESMQRAAVKALDKNLRDLDKRHGFRRIARNVLADTQSSIEDYHSEDWVEPFREGQIATGVVTRVGPAEARVRIGRFTATLGSKQIAWTGRTSPAQVLKVGDLTWFRIDAIDADGLTLRVTLEQEPEVEGSFLALDVKSGQVKAMVGGFDFNRSKFNRATQAMRQTGSAFKPFVYATAIDGGLTAATLLLDAPVSYTDASTGEIYAPTNYDGTYEGWVTVRHALEKSRNVPAIRMGEQVGLSKVADMARRLGLSGELPPYLSLALGSAEASLTEMVSAYSAFANQGIRMRPYFVEKVTDRDGNLLEETRPAAASAIRADTAYVMTNMLRGVIQRGTAARAARLGRPLAGKTGTTNDYTDAWFIGFEPNLIAGVWVGFDQEKSMRKGEEGARAALPAWIDFMEQVLKDRPVQDFPIPSNVVFVPIDRLTGYPSPGASPNTLLEAFITGTEPTGYP